MNGTLESQIDTEIAIINERSIKDKIYTIRGQMVMLDSDLADIYGYEVKRLNEQVKRNIERFPDDFMFQLSQEEINSIKLQIASSSDNLKSQIATSSWGGNRKLPYAFTELGINMLSAVLKSELAVSQSIALIRIFRKMKNYIINNQPLIGDKTLQQLALQTINNSNDIAEIKSNMVKISDLPDIIRSFGFSAAKCEYLILNGETVEASVAYRNIYGQAKESICIIDNYIDIKTLYLLNDIGSSIKCQIFSDNIGNKLRLCDYNNFSAEYNIHIDWV